MSFRLKQLRLEHHYTQKFVAGFLCCSVKTYARYEKEDSDLPVHLLILLSDLYQVSIDYLTGFKVERNQSELSPDYKSVIANARAQVMRQKEKHSSK